ncbi:MAG TPA: MmgE/PrpD family protein, partial [Thermoleophilia bacterium]|nr:MmgE/PrpD family protein [Thermoleophilia bacterium]
VMLRIGRATGRSNEHRGFHAPGTTGPFGAAVACALLLDLDTDRLLNAIGIAGSLASGLRQFSVSKTGSMVKRLHFGRAAESGVLAASLAAEGIDGPHDILEGNAGFLKVFCDHYDVSELTRGLEGDTFLVREIAMKRFATHGSSQIPLQALLDVRARHIFSADEIESIHVAAAREAVEHHDNPAPTDLMQAQYSVPFCIALACVRDARVRYEVGEITDKRTCEMTVTLRSGAVHKRTLPEPGIPWRPANRDETYEKYAILMRDCARSKVDELFERIQTMDTQARVD